MKFLRCDCLYSTLIQITRVSKIARDTEPDDLSFSLYRWRGLSSRDDDHPSTGTILSYFRSAILPRVNGRVYVRKYRCKRAARSTTNE